MGEHQPPRTCFAGHGGRLAGGHVPRLDRQPDFGLEERGLAEQQVDTVGELDCGVARPRVHHDGDAVAGPPLADLVYVDTSTLEVEPALALEHADLRALYAEGPQPVGQEVAAGRFLYTPTDCVDGVIERPGFDAQRWAGLDRAVADNRLESNRLPPPDAGIAEVLDVALSTGRIVDRDLVQGAVEGQSLQHTGEPEAVVAVQVGQTDPGDAAGRDPGEAELALGALAGVEEDALAIPAQEVAVVVPGASGYLAGCAQDDQVASAHPCQSGRGKWDAVAPTSRGVRLRQ
jgi:hypothetical protein